MKTSLVQSTKEILALNSITPLVLLKGEREFAFNGRYLKRTLFDTTTVVYDALYCNKPVIVKIYLYPKNNLDRFKREIYVYKNCPVQFVGWKNVLSDLYLSAETPLPYLIIEKVNGKPLGSWCNIENTNTVLFQRLLQTITTLHSQTSIPKNYLRSPHYLIDYYLNKFLFTFSFNKFGRRWKQIWNSYLQAADLVKSRWHEYPDTFIFTDLHPSNIIVTNTHFKLIDFDSISLGKGELDLAFLYLAALGTVMQEEMISQIISFISPGRRIFFNFFLFYLALFQYGAITRDYSGKKIVSLKEELEKCTNQFNS